MLEGDGVVGELAKGGCEIFEQFGYLVVDLVEGIDVFGGDFPVGFRLFRCFDDSGLLLVRLVCDLLVGFGGHGGVFGDYGQEG